MSVFVRQLSQIANSGMQHASAPPHWLTHLGALGIFSVAVIDSSVIPLSIPGSTDLLLLWLIAHGGVSGVRAASATAGGLRGGTPTGRPGGRGGKPAWPPSA